MSNKAERIKQVYGAYLDALYDLEYYKCVHSDLQSRSRHFEFIIALGGALSGGSGLGILASPYMAYPCGIITAASFILTVAKQTYDWPTRARFAVDMIEKSGRIAGKLKSLMEDIWASEDWTPEFEKSFETIRSDINALPQDSAATLKDKITNALQDKIIAREQPERWWKGPNNAERK